MAAVDVRDAGAERITNITVVDGDSVEGQFRGEWIRARLYGIDAPELPQPGGPQCAERLEQLVRASGSLMAEVMDVDQYDRFIILLYPASSGRRDSLNLRMARDGYAYAFTRFGGGEIGVKVAERDARESKRGVIWESGEGGERPWDYRSRQREGFDPRAWRDRAIGAALIIIVFAALLYWLWNWG